jgi:hypothetical protein
VTRQVGIHLAFMKADLVRCPTLVPEFRFHVPPSQQCYQRNAIGAKYV